MEGAGRREGREAQGKVLRAVLLAGDKGLTEEELEQRCEGLGATDIEAAVESLIATGLLERIEARLHPSGPATRFDRSARSKREKRPGRAPRGGRTRRSLT